MAQKQEIEVLEIQIAAERTEYNNEIGRISRELQTVEDELRTGNNYARMSDYQKGDWQRESKNLESQIKTLERELEQKPSLSFEDDFKAKALKTDKIKVSGNFMVWKN